MYKGRKILGLIPARGGSKGLPGKNIKLLLGKPLISWTIAAAKRSKYLDRVILSSEDAGIIKVAAKYGCEVPYVRPKKLAGDNTPGIEPVLHAIRSLAEKFDYIVLLQPTSPLRTAADIDACVKRCLDGAYQSCVSVAEAEQSPYWMFLQGEKGHIKPLIKTKRLIARRQDLPKVYALNGAVYVADCRELVKSRSFIMRRTAGYEMPGDRSLDIDTLADFKAAECLLRAAGRSPSERTRGSRG